MTWFWMNGFGGRALGGAVVELAQVLPALPTRDPRILKTPSSVKRSTMVAASPSATAKQYLAVSSRISSFAANTPTWSSDAIVHLLRWRGR